VLNRIGARRHEQNAADATVTARAIFNIRKRFIWPTCMVLRQEKVVGICTIAGELRIRKV
jgi:hypothetical protein